MTMKNTTNTEPTEREKKNWETFYEVMEKYTRENEARYYGGDAIVCLIGLTASSLAREGNECIVNAKLEYRRVLKSDITTRDSPIIAYDSNCWALAKCYHIHPDVVNRIFWTAGRAAFCEDLGDALTMAREYLAEADRLGFTWEKYLNEANEVFPCLEPTVVREMVNAKEDEDDYEYDEACDDDDEL